ncbi:MAG TPA: S41 family peptidase [Armatimonadota bacterium]|nr:S41 family peptidase [Armatimonadota bacterium]
MQTPGYYRFPAIHKDTIVFTSEEDLWTVPAAGGIARRLTATPGQTSRPFFSPDGSTLAFTGREEGHTEVYTMPAEGGPDRRVTHLGVNSSVLGWTPDGARILFISNSAQPFGVGVVYSVSPDGGLPEPWPVGPAVSISFGPRNRSVIGRNNNDPARWKRYRGGTAGDIWVDSEGEGEFHRLLRLRGNVASPLWIGDRIYFLSDHEGTGNLYSCLPTGEDITRHTHRADYYVRYPNTDGQRIVYHAGADLFIYDPATGRDQPVNVDYLSPRAQRQRKFVDPAKHLESYAPHPEGHSLAVTTRGKSFTMGNWEGAVAAQGGDPITPRNPVRYRLTRWLADGNRVVTVTDRGGEERLEIHSVHNTEEADPVVLDGLDIGRPYALRVSPTEDQIALANHRNELIFIDLKEETAKIIDSSPYRYVMGMDWSPDGRWLAYGFPVSQYTTAIKLWDRTTGTIHQATDPILHDMEPFFDPEGKYLYFLANRDFNPVYDSLHFDLGFPRGMRPFLITLRADLPSPFTPAPHPLVDKPKPDAKDGSKSDAKTETPDGAAAEAKPAPEPVVIDLEGISNRVLGFPVPEGLYGQISGIKGKAIFTSFPSEGALGQNWMPGDPQAKGSLEMFEFETLKHEPLLSGITDFQLAQDGATLYYRAKNRLRAIKAGEKPDEKASAEPPGRRSGWIELGRVKVAVDPGVEWRQMAREAWKLQRDYFWTPDMSHIDWNAVWDRYAPLVDRVGTRAEFSDLMWEMQGELGTSHAYEFGGDYRQEPSYPQGFLGADYEFDAAAGAYRIARIVQGAPGEPAANSPLNAPGVNVGPGDKIRAINGRRLTPDITPQELLVHQANSEVILTIEDSEGKTREVTVKALGSEFPARYREWVEANRKRVHEESGGRVGYVHIPDMGANGYAHFHRLYLAEVERDALLVDVRYNGGGHVSQLLIEKLARKRVGYDIQRWGQPEPYPSFSVGGPMVALTNQWAGSDGDIFSHVFKLMKLGPLIGVRTWGGVIGISPRNLLADGSMTTQPEYSFWFEDVGWGVENYGTDPDIEVDIAPQDYARGYDPQMEKALAVILERLEKEPVVRPSFEDRPNLSAPPLITPQEA